MTRWLYRRRWSVVCVLAAYGLARAAADIWLVPLPEGAVDLVSFGLMLLFTWLLASIRVHGERQPDTPLDTQRGT